MPRNSVPPAASTKPAAVPGKRPATIPANLLVAAAAKVEPNTTLGAVVFDRTTGATPLAYNADRSFRSASLVKLLIAIDALENGADAEDREQVARMLRMSDDDIASLFWVQDGGPRMVARTAAELGLTGVSPPEVSGRWGEVVVTPRDIVTIYRYVLSMPPDDSALIVDSLGQAPRVAADGFDQHFGIPDGMRAQWAIKQGWGNNDETMVLHSTGLVGPRFRYVVVLLTEHPLGSGWARSAQSVTAAAAALGPLLPGA